jgi:HSP20 family protein
MATRAWNPWNEMVTLREAMNQLLEDSYIRPSAMVRGATGTGTFSFPLSVYGTADELKVEALLPGVSPEDVQVDLDRGVLTIAAKRHGWEPTEGQTWFLREIQPGQFSRSLTLPFPVEVEQAEANFTNGVLTLTLPKAAAAKPKRIQIGQGQPQAQIAEGAQS